MGLIPLDGTLLVTGGSGFMGSSFIRFLFEKSNFLGKIINFDLLTYAVHPKSLQGIQSSPRYRFIQGDISDLSFLEEVVSKERIDGIVHFAAETHVDRSIRGPAIFMDTNIRGTFSLLEVIRRYPFIHFHHISTDEVYGSLGEGDKFYEHSSYRPNSPYAASKASSDHLVRAYANTYNISTTLSHACNNYGPYQYPEKLIPLMIRNALKGKKLPIYGKGNQVREWLFVEEHARAIWQILQKGKRGEVYNIGGKEEISNLSLVKKILYLLSQETFFPEGKGEKLLEFVQDRPGHDFRYSLDTQKIEKEVGFFPKIFLEEGLLRTVRWNIKQFIRKEGQKIVS